MRFCLVFSFLLVCFGFTPSAIAITLHLNGVCEYGGACQYNPYFDMLPAGQTASYDFNLIDTWKSTDQYRVQGGVQVESIPGPNINAGASYLITDSVTVTYLGNSTNTPTAPQEILTVDLFQGFENAFPLNRLGTATEVVSGTISSNFLPAGFVSTQPYTSLLNEAYNFPIPVFRAPSTSYSATASLPVANYSASPISADNSDSFYFSAGAAVGTSASMNNRLTTVLLPTPEPDTRALLLIAGLGLLLVKNRFGYRRFGRVSRTSQNIR